MNKWFMLTRRFSSMGTGYQIEAVIDGQRFEGMFYIGYRKRDAIKLYRRKMGLVGKHFEIVEY